MNFLNPAAFAFGLLLPVVIEATKWVRRRRLADGR